MAAKKQKKTAKKPAAKKPATKKLTKPSSKRPASAKRTAKPSKKAPSKRARATESAQAKQAAKPATAPARDARGPAKTAIAANTKKLERWTKFPPVLEDLVSWVNEGRAGGIDFEMYGEFNEQYKPSDWTRNPASDDELFTFGMDGSGGQVAIWRRDPDAAMEDLPIVFLGSEGEVRPLATSLPAFLYLLASGLGPIEAVFGGDDEPTPNEAMLEWVRDTYAARTFPDARSILDEAAEALAGFEAHINSTTRS